MRRDVVDAVCLLLCLAAVVAGAGLALVGAVAAAHGAPAGVTLGSAGLVLLGGGALAAVALDGCRRG